MSDYRLDTINLSIAPEPGMMKRDAPIDMVVNGQPDTVIYLGLGNEGRAPLRAVRLLERLGVSDVAVVGALPYWNAEPTAASLMGLAIGGSIAAAERVKELQYENGSAGTLHAIGESQAAPGLARAGAETPEIYSGRLALLRPLGVVGGITKSQFAVRATRTGMQPEQLLDWRQAAVGARFIGRLVQDGLQHGGAQINFGLSPDLGTGTHTALSYLAAAKPGAVRVFAGERDLLFPADDIAKTLDGLGLGGLVETIPGSHSSPATRAGAAQMPRVLEWCRASDRPEAG